MIKKSLLIFALLYFFGIAAIWLDGATTGYEKSEYAVVLGNQVYPSGEPSERLKARLERAAELFRDGTVQQIIVSGGLGKEGHDEASVMKQYLEAQGIPPTSIILHSFGNNTELTASYAAEILQNNMNKSIIAVSQLYHLSRTKMAFAHAGFKDVGVAYPHYFEWRDVYASLREVPAWLKYRWQVYTEPECEDFLAKMDWKIAGLVYQSCHREVNSQTRKAIATYRVEGKYATVVEQLFRERTGMPAMKFACCGWEVQGASSFGTEIPGTVYGVFMMSDETGINERGMWDKIPSFTVKLLNVYWADI
ncbi:DUF4952 domain-containing protein [Thiothrix unzii]|uniref:DUF4952 domain-containing protein n=1 Tax=Thiothrix unzii TaxID=111769 RepID=A0A975FA04_9GAMM|nr:DUF4952 domain-containing protein [Thiothrix unzii]QTR53654.1 DUF4952 domain-containing protein [Thiothrix unzii]